MLAALVLTLAGSASSLLVSPLAAHPPLQRVAASPMMACNGGKGGSGKGDKTLGMGNENKASGDVIKASADVSAPRDAKLAVCYTNGLEDVFRDVYTTHESTLKWLYYGTAEGRLFRVDDVLAATTGTVSSRQKSNSVVSNSRRARVEAGDGLEVRCGGLRACRLCKSLIGCLVQAVVSACKVAQVGNW